MSEQRFTEHLLCAWYCVRCFHKLRSHGIQGINKPFSHLTDVKTEMQRGCVAYL